MLRQYLYIDESFVNDAFATINGYDYSQKDIRLEGEAMLQEDFETDSTRRHSEKKTTEIAATMSMTAKCQAVYDYLAREAGGEIPFYDTMSDSDINAMKRESFFEGQFKLSYTKIETYGQLSEGLQKLGVLFGTDIVGNNAEAFEGLQKLAKQEREKGTPCILTFADDSQARCFAYLKEDNIRTKPYLTIGEVTVLCKVVRKIKQGSSVCLTDITEWMRTRFPDTPKGKKARIDAIKSGQMKEIEAFEDRIKGPALELVPIAIYR